jgi:Domain of unknown function (DUF4460)/Domain of unknown function (DUF4461)
MWPRSIVTNTGSLKSSDLKRYLSRLYLKVHPDLLNQHPAERAVNETSFKLLQEALKDLDARRSAHIYHGSKDGSAEVLKFYFRGGSSAGSSQQNKVSPLMRASVVLKRGRLGDALHELFVVMGLDPPPAHLLPRGVLDSKQGNMWPRGQTEVVSLTHLVRQARQVDASFAAMRTRHEAAASRAREWRESDSAHDYNIARLVLKRSRGVTVKVGDGLPKTGGEYTALSRLSSCLDGCREVNLSGLTTVLDGGFDVRLHAATASLRLGLCANVRLWDQSIRSKETANAAADRRKLSEKECAVAESLGIGLIFYREEFGSQGNEAAAEESILQYKNILQFLEKYSQDGEKKLVRASNLSVMLCTTFGDSSSASKADEVEGVIKIPISVGGTGALRAITSEGVALAARHARLRAKIEAEAMQMARISRALRIRDLRRGDGVSDAQWNSALDELWRDAGRIGGILDRQGLVIGKDARVLDTGEVQIPWNFHKVMPL